MSEFLAEARIVVRPDTTRFRAELEAQLRAVTSTPIRIPVVASISSSVAAAAGATGALAAEQRAAQTTTLGLTAAAELENTAFGRQAVILRSTAVASDQLAGAQTAAASVSRANASAAALHARQLGQLQRGAASSALTFLGLRGATLAASGAFLAGAASVVAFAKAIGSAARLETSLAVFEVTAGATADQMERVSQTARELGADLTLPGVTANQAADALANLARAGLTVDDSIDGVRGTLQLATAAAIGNEEAVTLVASALNAFQLSGNQAVRVADLLAASANESQGSISDMGLALQQSAAAAHQAGVSLGDTVSLLTLLARAGLRGSDAGTSLRVALIRLIAPTEQAQKAMANLGVNIRDAAGNVRPEIFADLTRQLNRLTRAQRDATLVTIFGADAFRAAAIIGGAAARGLNETRAAVEKQGVAAKVAAARTQGLAGAAEKVKNEFAALGLTIGDAFKEDATAGLNFFAEGLQNINTALEKAGELAGSLSGQNREQSETWVELADRAGRYNFILSRGGTRSQDFRTEVARLNQALVDQQSEGLKAASAIEEYRINVRLAADASEGLNSRLDESFDRFQRLADAVKEASRGLFLGPTEKADIASILAGGTEGLEDDIAAAQRRLALINKRLQDFKGNRNQFAALVKEQAQAQAELARLQNLAANQAQTAAKAAATKARQELAAADAELLARQALARNRLENLIAAAALTPILSDNIRRQQELRALVKKQIKQIGDQIKDATTEQQALVAARAILIKVAAALDGLAETQKQLAQKRRDALTDILGQRLRLAELRGGRDEILAALNAAIADAISRKNAAKTLADRLAEEIALQELINRRNDLLAQKTEDGNKAAEFFFEQLQAQQGFAANLLGNLIPSGSTSGLVGVPAVGAPSLGIPVSPPGGAGGDVDIGFGAAAGLAEGKGRTSPTAGQASTTNEILRRILKELKDLNRAADSPEAVYQRKMGSAAMSGGGGNTEV